jgi:hypothetical protein
VTPSSGMAYVGRSGVDGPRIAAPAGGRDATNPSRAPPPVIIPESNADTVVLIHRGDAIHALGTWRSTRVDREDCASAARAIANARLRNIASRAGRQRVRRRLWATRSVLFIRVIARQDEE